MSESTDNVQTLSPAEASALKLYESIVSQYQMGFFETGDALRQIRDRRLFRTTYGTFADYCEQRWGAKVNYANKLIAAADVVTNLRVTGTTVPVTERHARELIRLEDPDQQRAAWDGVLDRVNSDPKKVTSKIVKEEVDKLLPDKDDPEFVASEELAAIRKAVTSKVKKCPRTGRTAFGEAVGKVVDEVLSEITPEAMGEAAPLQAWSSEGEVEPEADDEGGVVIPHPFEDLRTRVIALQRDIKAALNEATPDAARLREIMSWARVLLFPGEMDAGPVEFLPTLGIPILLRLAVDPNPKPKLNQVKVTNAYMAAAKAWIPPKIVARIESQRRREMGEGS